MSTIPENNVTTEEKKDNIHILTSGPVSSHTALAKEVEETAVYAKYRYDDISTYIQQIEKLSFLECAQMVKDVEQQIRELVNVHASLEALKGATAEEDGTSLGTDVAQKNLLSLVSEDGESDPDVEAFYANYEHNYETLCALKAALQAKVAEAESKHSSKFINDEMIRLIEKKMRNLDPAAPNYNYSKKRYDAILDAFSNRMDLKNLTARFYIKCNNKAFRRDMQKVLNSGEFSISKLKGLKRIATMEQIKCMEYYLRTIFGLSYWSNAAMFILDKIAFSESKSGKDSYVKVLILNFVDICSRTFDLGDIREYFMDIRKSWHSMIILGLGLKHEYVITEAFVWAALDDTDFRADLDFITVPNDMAPVIPDEDILKPVPNKTAAEANPQKAYEDYSPDDEPTTTSAMSHPIQYYAEYDPDSTEDPEESAE